MSVVPSKDVEAIEYFENHMNLWAEAGAGIGVVAAQSTGVINATEAAREAYKNQQVAKQDAKAATVTFQAAMKVMRTKGGDLIKTVKAFAANSPDPAAIYANAQIDPPAPPSPAAPPGQPTDFTVLLSNTSGEVTLKWKASNGATSTGAFFVVQRKLSGESNFITVGTTGSKTFIDESIPAGTTGLQYVVRGFRGTTGGIASEIVGLQFGPGGSGVTNATLKMAA